MANRATLRLEQRMANVEKRLVILEQGLVRTEEMTETPVIVEQSNYQGLSTTNLMPERTDNGKEQEESDVSQPA